MELVESVLKNIYQSNSYRKDLSWPHFNDLPRVQGKQQVKDHQFCIFGFVACLTIPSSNWGYQPRCDNSIHSVHWGITLPLSKTPPLFLAKVPLKLPNCSSPPFFRQFPPLYWFFMNSPPPFPSKSQIFQ